MLEKQKMKRPEWNSKSLQGIFPLGEGTKCQSDGTSQNNAMWQTFGSDSGVPHNNEKAKGIILTNFMNKIIL